MKIFLIIQEEVVEAVAFIEVEIATVAKIIYY